MPGLSGLNGTEEYPACWASAVFGHRVLHEVPSEIGQGYLEVWGPRHRISDTVGYSEKFMIVEVVCYGIVHEPVFLHRWGYSNPIDAWNDYLRKLREGPSERPAEERV